ncbi:FIVAR domain-containing protein [Aeromicrobium sp. UC242_57]|uniref:FIVAR domain-containing protein n=1 Tax=Aeromicrobium sp. UC242_57 TaxID=3374624 RepID=UPI003795F572
MLQHVYDEASTLSNSDDRFTADSWAALQSALAEAKVVLDDQGAAQAQIDEAAQELTSAVTGLELTPAPLNTAVLQDLLATTAKLSNSGGKYTKDSWARLQTEVTDATKVLKNASATQSQIDQATIDLYTAWFALVPAKPVVPVVSKVKLNQSQLRLVKGRSVRLEDGVYYSDGRSAFSGATSWKSSNRGVATVGPRLASSRRRRRARWRSPSRRPAPARLARSCRPASR